MGRAATPEPREQSWDGSIKERAAGEETAESRGALEPSLQPEVSPQRCPRLYPLEEADPQCNTHPLHCSCLEGCNNSEAAESTGLISHQCPSMLGGRAVSWEASRPWEGGRREEGREGGVVWVALRCADALRWPGAGEGSLPGVRPTSRVRPSPSRSTM